MSGNLHHETLDKWSLHYRERTQTQKLVDHFKGKIIVFAGTPGVGKSTLCQELAQFTNAVYYPEYVSVPLLNQFHGDMHEYAYVLQIVMAQKRISFFAEAIEKAKQGHIVIVDGPLICDNAFAKMHWRDGRISDAEYSVYQNILDEEVGKHLIEPDYMVFLDSSEEKALTRIKKRGREGEHDAYKKDKYLTNLRSTFHEVFENVTVNYIDYEDDHLDEEQKLPDLRMIEILGLIRDRTFQRVGIPKQYTPMK